MVMSIMYLYSIFKTKNKPINIYPRGMYHIYINRLFIIYTKYIGTSFFNKY